VSGNLAPKQSRPAISEHSLPQEYLISRLSFSHFIELICSNLKLALSLACFETKERMNAEEIEVKE